MDWAGRSILAVVTACCLAACRDATGPVLTDDRDPTAANERPNIAFARYASGRLFDIFIVSENGFDLTNLTDHAASDLNPVWSPDGTQIAFESNRGGPTNVYAMMADGKNVRNVSNMERQAADPTWSPDGAYIVFQGETVSSVDVYRVSLNDLTKQNLTGGQGVNFLPRYSPDGRFIAFVSSRGDRYGLYIMHADGNNQRRLTDISGLDVSTALAWSLDGTELLYNSTVNGARDVLAMGVASGRIRNLTNHPADDFGGDWSLDGKEVVFQSNREGISRLYQINADGSNLQRITSGNDEWFPSYSPTSKRVLFLTSRRGAFEIWIVDLAGLVENLVTPTQASDRTPRWRPARR